MSLTAIRAFPAIRCSFRAFRLPHLRFGEERHREPNDLLGRRSNGEYQMTAPLWIRGSGGRLWREADASSTGPGAKRRITRREDSSICRPVSRCVPSVPNRRSPRTRRASDALYTARASTLTRTHSVRRLLVTSASAITTAHEIFSIMLYGDPPRADEGPLDRHVASQSFVEAPRGPTELRGRRAQGEGRGVRPSKPQCESSEGLVALRFHGNRHLLDPFRAITTNRDCQALLHRRSCSRPNAEAFQS